MSTRQDPRSHDPADGSWHRNKPVSVRALLSAGSPRALPRRHVEGIWCRGGMDPGLTSFEDQEERCVRALPRWLRRPIAVPEHGGPGLAERHPARLDRPARRHRRGAGRRWRPAPHMTSIGYDARARSRIVTALGRRPSLMTSDGRSSCVQYRPRPAAVLGVSSGRGDPSLAGTLPARRSRRPA